MVNFKIDIVSDTVCPWCYIGKKRLEKAISLYRTSHPSTTDTFTTTWLPFYLNPDPTCLSIDKESYMTSRFGAERAQMIRARLTQAGEAEGIHFKFGGKTGYTRDSHRLIQLAKMKAKAEQAGAGAGAEVGTGTIDLQTPVVEELFTAYFENEEDITAREVLVRAGVRAGLEEAEVKKWLESGEGGEVVDREVEEARGRRFVTGVPHFTIQGKYVIEGAEGPGEFLEVFERIKGEEGG
ncbi:hypothetical protein AJ79_01185 [Helicocarpus griseus UAMH5409]|uniref:DSBA-like thioredoxin domain-containing protein n=1 Tax=Helicocarpus griseus UAMH5409 TaxID=1447875 RepID=A0A2B7Y8C0_9EURO|nr:hypothetical protein AJ79_01185 [Helicocarpus griseus UAMH5409]